MKIVDCRSGDARAHVDAQRRAGYPCVLTGFNGMTGFAENWVGRRGKTDFKRLCKDLGDEIVTCIKKQDMSRIGKEGGIQKQGGQHLQKMSLRKFVSRTFLKAKRKKKKPSSDSEEEETPPPLPPSSSSSASSPTPSSSKLYLHQWQFGMSASARYVIDKLSRRSGVGDVSLPECLGQDHLDGVFEEFGSKNPYQYLFCGPGGTWTPIHRDPGGLAILIAPITGEKEVTLVHRDDGYMIGDSWKTEESLGKAPNLHRQPMASFARVWRHTVS